MKDNFVAYKLACKYNFEEKNLPHFSKNIAKAKKYDAINIMEWFLLAIAFAFFNALTMLISQHFKLNGHLMSGLRGIGVGIIYFPFLFFCEIPKSAGFWVLIALEGAISIVYNEKLYAASAKYGASSTSIIMVLSVALGMVFWWIIDLNRFLALIHNPLILCGIICSVIFIALGFFITIKNSFANLQLEQLKFTMPAVFLLSVMMICRKEIMLGENFVTAMTYYCTVSIFLSGVVNIAWFRFIKKKAGKNTKTILSAGVLMALASAITILCGNASSLYCPNPAYINAVCLTSPLWIVLFDKFIGKKDDINYAGLALMLSAMLALIYFANSPILPPYH